MRISKMGRTQSAFTDAVYTLFDVLPLVLWSLCHPFLAWWRRLARRANIDIYRDWGWAPDYVEAIYKINTAKKAKDYVVGTGKITSLKTIINNVLPTPIPKYDPT